jgi:metal-sulfur cluster biosynthetic enzyme
MAAGPLSITILFAGGGSGSEADQSSKMLHDVIDPELGVDITFHGLRYDSRLQDQVADVLRTATTSARSLGVHLSDEIERWLLTSDAVERARAETTKGHGEHRGR